MTGEAVHHSVSVAGVVIDENGRALVIQRRDNGHWEPPGGVLERDEAIIEGLLREVREETGLIVEPLALTGVYKNMRLGVLLTRRAASARCVVPLGSGEAVRQPGPLVLSRGPPTSQWGHKSAQILYRRALRLLAVARCR